MRDAQLNLGFTQVKAPFKGRISNRRVDVGNLIDASTLLTTVVQLDPIYVGFDMPEADYLAYQRAAASGELPSTRDRETPVDVKLVDETDWMHPGTMDFVDNVVSQTSGTIRGRAVIPNPGYLITPGCSAASASRARPSTTSSWCPTPPSSPTSRARCC